MPDTVHCKHCGSYDCKPIDNEQYQCNHCGKNFAIAEAEAVQPPEKMTGAEIARLDKKQVINIILGVILVGVIFGYGIYSSNKSIGNQPGDTQESAMESMEEHDAAPKYTEFTQSFQVVPGLNGPEIWTIKRRNSSNLKEVDYRLSIQDPASGKELYTKPIISTMTWDQSFDKNFQIGEIKRSGSRCWIIIGGKDLVGYDIISRQKTMDNLALTTQFHQFADGISNVEDLNNIDGFKVTSPEGFTYYYLPESNKVLTEVEYDNVRRNENTNNTSWEFHTQYVFSEGNPQQLYKLVRRHQNLRIRKIFSSEVNDLLNDESLWYRKMYNVVSMEEFTPGQQYYNGNVLFNDEDYCVFISTRSAQDTSAILVRCLDKNRSLKWSVAGSELELFLPFLKAPNVEAFRKNNEMVFQIPYQLAVSVNINTGKLLWKYKLPKTAT